MLKRLTWLEHRLEKLLFARRRGRPGARGRRTQINRVRKCREHYELCYTLYNGVILTLNFEGICKVTHLNILH